MSTTTVDSKRRIVLPKARVGDVFDVQRTDESHWVLVRLEKPVGPGAMKRKVCLEAMRRNPLRSKFKWEQLRGLTREP